MEWKMVEPIVVTAIQHVTLSHAVSSFITIALAGKAKATKEWYETRLDLLVRALGGNERLLSDLLEADLIQWRSNLETQHISPDTLHGYVRAARRWLHWLNKRGLIAQDLTSELYLPQLPKRGRKGITDHDANLILEEARRWSKRDYAMILFMASTSARRGGVAGLTLDDLRVDQPEPYCRQVRVFEKGQKERTVIMDPIALAALLDWLAERPTGSNHVFVTAEGEPLTADAVSQVLKRYKQKLGLSGNCSPHQWRHRWFRRMISNRMPLAQAAQLGGHATVDITYRYYGQFAIPELQEAYDKYFKPD
jgi:integrase/recombinase XerD